MINPNILALPIVAIAIAEPFFAFSATWRAFSSSANNFSRVYSSSKLRGRHAAAHNRQSLPHVRGGRSGRSSPLPDRGPSLRASAHARAALGAVDTYLSHQHQPKEGSYVRYVADRSHPEIVRRQGKRECFQIAPGG